MPISAETTAAKTGRIIEDFMMIDCFRSDMIGEVDRCSKFGMKTGIFVLDMIPTKNI